MRVYREWVKRLSVVGAALFFVLPLSQTVQPAQTTPQGGVGGIASSAVGSYQNSWAVVIGINRYLKAPRLNYAVNDAKSVVAAVQRLGFPANNVILLLDREATKQRIEQVLYETLSQASPEDRVLVFFAGHGLTASLPRGGEEGYLLPVDGDPDNLPLTAISMDDVRKISRRIPAKHILFAVDACYSGFAITRDIPPTKVDAIYLEAVTKEPAVQIITAGRKGEQVLEEEGHGLFTRRLLNGLTGLADTDQNGIITAQELATWLESRVIRDSQNRQHPQYSRLDGEGQFVFVVPRKQQAPPAGESQAVAPLPKVVRVIPESGAVNVAPSLKEIIIVFDQPMSSGWSIGCSPVFFPSAAQGKRCTEGGYYWQDDRTFVIQFPSGLKPDQRYSLTINHRVGLEDFKLADSFRGLGQSRPVPPRRFFFTTGP